jgi:hypothetical protein
MKFWKEKRAEEKVLSDFYNPDREIRKQADELVQGNQ